MISLARHKSRRIPVLQANYHVVFIPKFRRPILNEPIVTRIKEIWSEQSKAEKFDVIIAEIMVDHVHLFMEILPSISVSEAIRKIKGKSGYLIRREYPEIISQFYWKSVFWARRYFLRTVGDITAQTAIRYIRFQHEHHDKQVSIKEQIRSTQREFKTLDNWFNLKVIPRLEEIG